MARPGKPCRRRLIAAGCVLAAVLAAVAWWALLAGAAPTFHAVSLEPRPGAVAARQAFVASMDTSIIDLAWSADGETLYTYLNIGALDVWPALVHHWPELAMIVLGVGFGFGLRWLLRRRAHADGPHCRGCDYLLVKCSSDRCPECGLELTPANRVEARQPGWRLAITTLAFSALIGGYWLSREWLPRSGAVSEWMSWPSPPLFDRAYHAGGYLRRLAVNHKTHVYRVVELDPGSGRVTRTLLEAPDKYHYGNHMVLSSDGSTLAAVHGRHVSVWDTSTGRRLERIHVEGIRGPGGSQAAAMAALSADGRFVYLAERFGPLVEKRDARTGRLLEQLEFASLVPTGPAVRALVVSQATYLPHSQRLALLVYSIGTGNESVLIQLEGDLTGPAAEPRVVTGILWGVAIAPDGSSWYAQEAQGDLLAFDGAEDSAPRRVPLPGKASGGLALSPDGTMLAAARIAGRAGMGNVTASEVFATDPWRPMGSVAARLVAWGAFAFSRDGKRLAAAGSRRTQLGHSGMIAVYDTPAWPPPLKPPPPNAVVP